MSAIGKFAIIRFCPALACLALATLSPMSQAASSPTSQAGGLPSSQYDAELKGKGLRDVTREVHAALPFLTPDLRFFGAFDPIPLDQMPPLPVPQAYTLYEAMPDGRVVKLAAVGDFARLGVGIRSGRQALQLARFVTDPANTKAGLSFHFTGSEMAEIPWSGPCHHIRTSQLDAGLMYQVSLQELAGKKKGFVIKRFMLPNRDGALSFFNSGAAYLLHTRETVGADGSYVQVAEKVPHSMIVIDRCFLR